MTDAMTADEAMERTAIPILEYGRGWMMAPATGERAGELGLDGGLGFWTNGRAGALGEIEADAAAAAIGFMAPGLVRRHWETPCSLTHAELAAEYAAAAARWGREVLADLDDDELDRLATLCDRVADAATPSIGMLFTGWRNLERPDDPAGRATVALNVLREMRGGAHLSAVHAAGIGPHGAIMAAPDPVRGGAAGAERFGWADPHPTPDFEARTMAEALTSAACRPAYETLGAEDRSEFVRLVLAARAAMDT